MLVNGRDMTQKVYTKRNIKKSVSVRPIENRKKESEKTELIQTMVRLDFMPITVLNECKFEKGTHTHTR